MTDTRLQQRDKLVADFKLITNDVEELLRTTASDANGAMSEVQSRLRDRLHAAKSTLWSIEEQAVEKAKAVANTTDDYVRKNPWTSVGIGAGVGVLLGMLLARR
jgi:ElaB/YqjD/DUF883 family membrane-anchored ribosome-binding protein